MQRDLDAAASQLRDADDILIISHIDADGISAGAVADITAERLGKRHDVRFEKKISEETVEAINSSEQSLVWICDLGSGYLSEFTRDGIIVTDHHVPDPRWRRKQTGFMNWTPLLPSAAKVSFGEKDASLPGSVKRREKPPGRTAVMLEILYDKDGKKKCFPGFEHSQDCRKKWS